MKTILTLSARLFLFVLFVSSVSSCKKDDTSVTETCRTISQFVDMPGNPFYMTYYFDEQDRVTAILGKQSYAYITYIGDSAVYKEYELNGTLDQTFTLKTDAAGRFITSGNAVLEYNASGQLTKITRPSVEITYTWVDGNITKDQIRQGGVLTSSTNYTYFTEYENKAHWDYSNIGIDCFYGRATKNLLKKALTTDEINHVISNEANFTYTRNEKGLPVVLNLQLVNSGTFYNYQYNYECN